MTGQSFIIPMLSGLATALGGLAAVLAGRAGSGTVPVLLGLSSGIGFTLIFLEILPAAVQTGGWAVTAAGFAGGVLLGRATRMILPCLPGGSPGDWSGWWSHGSKFALLRSGYLLAIGVAAHNLPEGMAVGAGLEARAELGMLLAAAIGLHNIPEGMALAGVLMAGGRKWYFAVAVSAGAGLMLPAGALITGRWIEAGPAVIAFLLALGAGALLYIILKDLMPGAMALHPLRARLGLAAGSAASIFYSVYTLIKSAFG
jgi:ZIP family zinc transporter